MWVCEYDFARIIACRAVVGRDAPPLTTDVVVDVNKYDAGAATPDWVTIYTTQANRPKVVVDEFIGVRTVPDIVDLVEGDALCVDVDIEDGDAENLIVTVYMLVQSESPSTTIDLSS